MDFSETVQAQIDGTKLRCAVMAKFDFVSGAVYIWEGARTLYTPDGIAWLGLGRMAAEIEGIEQAVDGASPQLRMTLSGVDPTFAAKARSSRADYSNRMVTIFGQFFTADWRAALDDRFVLKWARMQSIKAKRESRTDGYLHSVTLLGETPFASTRQRPRFGYCTPTDQDLRYPGDRAFDAVPGEETKLITFPH